VILNTELHFEGVVFKLDGFRQVVDDSVACTRSLTGANVWVVKARWPLEICNASTNNESFYAEDVDLLKRIVFK
jgi:hypothetical protein